MKPLRIVAIFSFFAWWGKNFPPDVLDREDSGSVAGGENHYLEACFALAAAGHHVTALSDLIRPGIYRGVEFRPTRDQIRIFGVNEPVDVVMSWMQPSPLMGAPANATRIFVQQCNDLEFEIPWQGSCDAVVAASVNHGEFLKTLKNKKGDAPLWTGPYEVVHNGCYLEKYPDPPPPFATRPLQVGYWSSPDRGLHHLLAAWPHVVEQVPQARLKVAYEVKRVLTDIDYAVPSLKARLDTLRTRVRAAAAMPSVEFTGMLSRPALRRLQLQTRVHCYPLDVVRYTEGMGASVSEAMAAGCLPLARPVDAFPSVYDGGVRWIEGDASSRDFPKQLADQIARGLAWNGVAAPTWAGLRATAARWTWTNARAEFVRVVERCVARKRGDTVPPPAFPLEDPWRRVD